MRPVLVRRSNRFKDEQGPRLRGLRMLVLPETFWVVGTQGPLRGRELDRAAACGGALAARLAAAQAA